MMTENRKPEFHPKSLEMLRAARYLSQSWNLQQQLQSPMAEEEQMKAQDDQRDQEHQWEYQVHQQKLTAIQVGFLNNYQTSFNSHPKVRYGIKMMSV